MKKFYKICGVIAAAALVCGLLLCLVGMIAGASPFQMLREGNMKIYVDNQGIHTGIDESLADEEVSGNADEIGNMAETEGVYEAGTVNTLEISVDAAEMNIYTEDTDQIRIESHSSKSSCKSELKNGKLLIKQEGKMTISGSGKLTAIDVCIPSDKVFDSVKIDLDAGEIYIENISAKKLMEVDVDAGSVTCDAYSSEDIKADVDAGAIEFCRGSFTGTAQLECDAGSITFYVEGDENSLNYDLKSNIGGVEINGQEYSGISVEKKINNGANRQLRADAEAGSISIYTY